MAYGDYLRQQSSECIRLAVEQPWSDEAGDLIDLAQEYSSAASTYDGRSFGHDISTAGADPPGQARLFSWLTRH